jgi:electron transfer flavoprotein alpha subunit
MSVLVYIENWGGKLKKASFEAASYGKRVADLAGKDVTMVVLGEAEGLEALGQYGAREVIHVNTAALNKFELFQQGDTLKRIADEIGANIVVIPGTTNGKALSGMLGGLMGAGVVTNAVDVPESFGPLKVKRKAFSNKAFAWATVSTNAAILSYVPNSIGLSESAGNATVSERAELASNELHTEMVDQELASGKIPLPEAELVVSGGRGLKGPDNWGMLEELAEILGAGTACSKPVSDMGWRPHTEHVGQTGIAINPELYIAVGISGAIQHLAGVSASKNIVVINKDPEAPFFKAADYGIIGDAFEVIPKLNAALKAFKEGQG